jgi:hypothetical protein
MEIEKNTFFYKNRIQCALKNLFRVFKTAIFSNFFSKNSAKALPKTPQNT